MRTTIEGGKPGQFDVIVDDRIIAQKGASELTTITMGGWPDEDDVVDKIRDLF